MKATLAAAACALSLAFAAPAGAAEPRPGLFTLTGALVGTLAFGTGAVLSGVSGNVAPLAAVVLLSPFVFDRLGDLFDVPVTLGSSFLGQALGVLTGVFVAYALTIARADEGLVAVAGLVSAGVGTAAWVRADPFAFSRR